MGDNRRPLEVRIAEKQRLLEAEKKRLKEYENQMKLLNAKKREQDRKERTHRLIEVGATVESVLKAPITNDMLPRLLDWLESQERKGRYFSKAMGMSNEEASEHVTGEVDEVKTISEEAKKNGDL